MLLRALIVAALALTCASAETVRNPTKRAGAGPLFQVFRGDMWGFMDRKGHIAIAPAFLDERDFFHGLAGVELPNRKWGFINERGKFAIPPRFDDVRDFIDDLAPVRVERKWGYIDTVGRMVIEPRFQSAGEFHEGLAKIYVWSEVVCRTGTFTSENAPFSAFHLYEDEKTEYHDCFPHDGKLGYIDKSGTVVIAPQFFVAQNFSEGLAEVRIEENADSKYGYVDRSGHLVIAARFFQAGPFSEGLAAVETNARVVGNKVVDMAWGFIDKTGVIRISDKYDFAGSFSEGLARVALKMGVSEGYINSDGKMVIPARYSTVGDFSDSLAVACADECVYIDHSGSEVPPLKKISAYWPFSDGLAAVGFYGPTVYVNKKGKTIAPYAMK